MEPPLRSKAEIDPPARGTLQTYLGLAPPTEFRPRDLQGEDLSADQARKFAHEAAKTSLAVRVRRGHYVALDPSLPMRVWALPSYWDRLLAIHAALDHLGIDHAFACLSAAAETDLVPERPWLVLEPISGEGVTEIDRFLYDFRSGDRTEVTVLGHTFEIPRLGPVETALLLAATGLPRHREAAKALIEHHPAPERLAPEFNFLGLVVDPDIVESRRPDVELPGFVEAQRARLSDEILRGGVVS